MQYILTQEEYDALKKEQVQAISLNKERRQDLCTRIANEMPVYHCKELPPEPWGCILNTNSSTHYCDGCPVQDICPSDRKDWSQ